MRWPFRRRARRTAAPPDGPRLDWARLPLTRVALDRRPIRTVRPVDVAGTRSLTARRPVPVGPAPVGTVGGLLTPAGRADSSLIHHVRPAGPFVGGGPAGAAPARERTAGPRPASRDAGTAAPPDRAGDRADGSGVTSDAGVVRRPEPVWRPRTVEATGPLDPLTVADDRWVGEPVAPASPWRSLTTFDRMVARYESMPITDAMALLSLGGGGPVEAPPSAAAPPAAPSTRPVRPRASLAESRRRGLGRPTDPAPGDPGNDARDDPNDDPGAQPVDDAGEDPGWHIAPETPAELPPNVVARTPDPAAVRAPLWPGPAGGDGPPRRPGPPAVARPGVPPASALPGDPRRDPAGVADRQDELESPVEADAGEDIAGSVDAAPPDDGDTEPDAAPAPIPGRHRIGTGTPERLPAAAPAPAGKDTPSGGSAAPAVPPAPSPAEPADRPSAVPDGATAVSPAPPSSPLVVPSAVADPSAVLDAVQEPVAPARAAPGGRASDGRASDRSTHRGAPPGGPAPRRASPSRAAVPAAPAPTRTPEVPTGLNSGDLPAAMWPTPGDPVRSRPDPEPSASPADLGTAVVGTALLGTALLGTAQTPPAARQATGAPARTGAAGRVTVPGDLADLVQDRFGLAVRGVAVHRGPTVEGQAAALRARAFARDGQVFLPAAAGSLATRGTRALLVHELVHAGQQRVLGSALPAEGTVAGRALEADAVAAERWALHGERADPHPRSGPTGPALPVASGPAETMSAPTPAEPATSESSTTAATQSWTLDNGFAPTPPEAVDAGPPGVPTAAPPPQRADEAGPPADPTAGATTLSARLDRLAAQVAQLAEHPAPQPVDLFDVRHLDSLAGRLYRHIRSRLRAELLVDRERAGLLADLQMRSAR